MHLTRRVSASEGLRLALGEQDTELRFRRSCTILEQHLELQIYTLVMTFGIHKTWLLLATQPVLLNSPCCYLQLLSQPRKTRLPLLLSLAYPLC